jgi:hypothetical protein
VTSGSQAPASASPDPRIWLLWLQIVLGLVLVYALILVVAGPVAEWAFTALGFGPPATAESPEMSGYLRLPFAVLGAVLAGWAALMLILVRGPLKSGAEWAIPALVVPLAVWFVLDTGMSFLLGYPTHALFNVPFAIALGLPLWRIWAIRRERAR